MTLYSAGACSYRSVDHEVAAEYDGGGNENRCDDKKENVRDVRMSPFAGAICEKNVGKQYSPNRTVVVYSPQWKKSSKTQL